MSYKYFSSFDLRVFSGCQSLALHVVVTIRRAFHSAGAEQSALLKPRKTNLLKQPNRKSQTQTDLP